MLLAVDNVTPAKTGKSLRVKANGNWYGAKKDSGISAGMTIDAEVEDGEFGLWIQKWKATSNAAPQAPAEAPGSSPSRIAVSPAAWLPFASNTVAHAISAGLVKEPSQLKAWAEAAKQAYQELA